jgi:hypothetical protein
MTFYRLIVANIAEKRITYRNSTVMEEAVVYFTLKFGTTWPYNTMCYFDTEDCNVQIFVLYLIT